MKKNIKKGFIQIIVLLVITAPKVHAIDYQQNLESELSSIDNNYKINVSTDYRISYMQSLQISLSTKYSKTNYDVIVNSCNDEENTCNITMSYNKEKTNANNEATKEINVSYVDENINDKNQVLNALKNINEKYTLDSKDYINDIIKCNFKSSLCTLNLKDIWENQINKSINNNEITLHLYIPTVSYEDSQIKSSTYNYTNFFTLEKNGIIYYASHENNKLDKQVETSIDKVIQVSSSENEAEKTNKVKEILATNLEIEPSIISIEKYDSENYNIKINNNEQIYKIEGEIATNNNQKAEQIELQKTSSKNGWINENDATYYYINDVMQKGIVKIDNDYYFFGEGSGKLYKTPVTSLDGRKFFPNNLGIITPGWFEVNGITYYYDDEFNLVKGIQKIGTNNYFFGEGSGRLYKTPVTSRDGTIYYPDSHSTIKTGWTEVDGYTYYYDDNFKMLKGIQKIGEYYYFFGEGSGRLYKTSVKALDGTMYYPDRVGKIKTGWTEVDGYTYYYDENFKILKGIQKIEEYYYFFGEGSGRLYKTSVKALDGTMYYPDQVGKIKTGWTEVDGYTYYYDDNFKILKGIQKIGEYYYFFGEGSGRLYKTQVYSKNGDLYIPNVDGKLLTRWIENTYYTVIGKAIKGYTNINNKIYIFDESTYKLKYGWITYKNETYYANEQGEILINDQVINNISYYFTEKGILFSGWREKDSEKYYYVKGIMQKGITKIGTNYYFLGENSGKLWYGWVTSNSGNKYYSNNEGVLQKGIQKIGDNYYLFGEITFHMQKGWIETTNGKVYYANGNGILLKGNQLIEGSQYIINDDFTLTSGWYTIAEAKYYHFANGEKAVGRKKIAGKRYLFASDGKLLVSDCKIYIDISSAQVTLNSDGMTVNIDAIDWVKLWNSGEIDGVILKAGSGSLSSGKTYSKNTDFFKKAVVKCEELGIPYGIYWYSYAEVYNMTDYHEAVDEANLFIDTIKKYAGKNLQLGIYWDLEENHDKAQNNIMISKFMEIMHNQGYYADIYCNKNFAETILNDNAQYLKWIAHYTGSSNGDGTYNQTPNRKTGYEGAWKIWQFSDAGNIPGINGYVDLNVAI